MKRLLTRIRARVRVVRAFKFLTDTIYYLRRGYGIRNSIRLARITL